MRAISLLAGRVGAVAEVVDGVVAAPEDPVIGRAPVIVELIASIGHALGFGPADFGELARGQRLGDEHVVVDGEHT